MIDFAYTKTKRLQSFGMNVSTVEVSVLCSTTRVALYMHNLANNFSTILFVVRSAKGRAASPPNAVQQGKGGAQTKVIGTINDTTTLEQ